MWHQRMDNIRLASLTNGHDQDNVSENHTPVFVNKHPINHQNKRGSNGKVNSGRDSNDNWTNMAIRDELSFHIASDWKFLGMEI